MKDVKNNKIMKDNKKIIKKSNINIKEKKDYSNLWENIIAIGVVLIITILVIGFFRGWYSSKKVDTQIFPITMGDDPHMGDFDAPVTIIEFSDFQCPYCSQFAIQEMTSLKKYIDNGTVLFVYKDFPLAQIHPKSPQAANAAGCAFEQDKFWEYHDILYKHQDAIEINNLQNYAKDIGLNMTAFKSCFSSERRYSEITADINEGISFGVKGTPTFFINGRKYVGAPDFNKAINEALKRK